VHQEDRGDHRGELQGRGADPDAEHAERRLEVGVAQVLVEHLLQRPV
jgi:hypothetical protein